jgi:hypothetical protein
MKCKICGNESYEQFSAIVLGRYPVRYFLCGTCFFLQTEDPYWLKEAYRDSINASDTGMIARSIYYSKIVTALICLEFNREGAFLDYGGGYGLFTRLMRDVGFDYYWTDPFTQNLFARGFEWSNGTDRIELVTAFEAFEHFVNPLDEIGTMMGYAPNMFFSTEPLPLPPPPPDQWHYYAPAHGQHVSFYSSRTIQQIARSFNLNYYSDERALHFLTVKAIHPARFRFVMRYGKYLYPYFKKRMHSRTVDDVAKAMLKR